jgi:DnaJ family protein B protein 4
MQVVPGKGMPKRKEPGQRGDLIVSFQVVFPRTLPQDVKTKLRELLPSGR